MKKTRFFYLFAFAFLGFFMASCGDDEVTNTITIEIEEPADGETISDCADVHIHIDVTASVENHELEVILHPEGDVDDKIIDYDAHSHDQEINFEQEVNLCDYPAGTCFHLEVVACADHDCEETTTADVEFCLP